MRPSMPLGDLPPEVKRRRLKVECIDSDHVEVELLVSGVCTMAAVIPVSWCKMPGITGDK